MAKSALGLEAKETLLKRTFSIAGVAILMAASLYAVPPGTDDEINARLQPFGEICRQGDECGTAAAAVA